jgi:predicted nucleotidyltransferase
MMIDFEGLLTLLGEAGVEFIVIGGVAVVAHGSAYNTFDLDVCYHRTRENIVRLCHAVVPIHPTLRNAPKDIPFRFDPPTVQAGLNFTLDTDLGALDLLGEVPPLGSYPQVVAHSEAIPLFGLQVQVLSLDALIQVKQSTGRLKDKLVLPELEALLELKKQAP